MKISFGFYADGAGAGGSAIIDDVRIVRKDKAERVAGGSRYTTAIAIARKAWARITSGSRWYNVTHVVIASGEDRAAADPLAAAGLCYAYDAPLFLVQSTAVLAEVKQAVSEIKAQNTNVTVHIVGGTTSVPDARFNELNTAVGGGLTKDRILATGGRYDLAGAIAKRMSDIKGNPGTVLIANGADSTKFFDALALSPVSRKMGFPILLVKADDIPPATFDALNYIDPGVTVDIIIGGGPNTVAPEIFDFFDSVVSTERWYGSSRYTTAIDIANEAIGNGWLNAEFVGIAAKLPDALAGGGLVGSRGGVQLLTNGTSLTGETAAWLTSHKSSIAKVYVFGGVNSIAATTFNAIQAAAAN